MENLTDFNFIRYCYTKPTKILPLKDIVSYMDLTYCISGEMHYIYEGVEYVLTGGDAIVFPKGSLRTRKQSDIDTLYCSINISYENFEPKVKGYIPNCIMTDTLNVLEAMEKTFNSISDVKNDKCTSLFLYLYYQLIESAENNENPHIKTIKKYIARHYKEKITLEQIAKAVHLTPQYCSALFSKYMRHTLFDFISMQRVEEAKGLIVTTDYSLTEISEMVGYEDYNYFSRIFKKFTGINARNYRNSNK